MRAVMLSAELWTKIVSSLLLVDLKTLRLVHREFHSLVNPRLFQRLYLSIDQETLAAIDAWSRQPNLTGYVRTLTVDLAWCDPCMDDHNYALLSAHYFARLLGCQPDGPLHEQALFVALRRSTASSNGDPAGVPSTPVQELQDGLTGDPLAAFHAGFHNFRQRATVRHSYHFQDHLYQYLVFLLSRFPRIHQVDATASWIAASDARPLLAGYLRCHLPAHTCAQIHGLPPPTPENGADERRAFLGVGQSARSLHVMHVPPGTSMENSIDFDDQLLVDVLRAVQCSQLCVDRISLPCNNDGSHRSRMRDTGVPISLFSTINGEWKLRRKSLLLPGLVNLTTLQVQLDAHTVVVPSLNCSIDNSRFARSVLAMSHLRSLAIGFSANTLTPWSLFRTLLWQSESSDDVDRLTCDPLAATRKSHTPPNEGESEDRCWLNKIGQVSASLLPPLFSGPLLIPTGLRSSHAREPCPWPVLRQLCLWNMPFAEADLCCLLRTVASTLEDLVLDHLWVDRYADGLSERTCCPALTWRAVIATMVQMSHLRSCDLTFTDQDREDFQHMLEADGVQVASTCLERLVCCYVLNRPGTPFWDWIRGQASLPSVEYQPRRQIPRAH